MLVANGQTDRQKDDGKYRPLKLEFHGADTDTDTNTDIRNAPFV